MCACLITVCSPINTGPAMRYWKRKINDVAFMQTKRGAKPGDFAPAQCPGGALGGAPREGLGQNLGGDAEDGVRSDREEEGGGQNEGGGHQERRAGGGHCWAP